MLFPSHKIQAAAQDANPAGAPSWKPMKNERVLVLAPHPDDEIIAAGGVIAAINTYWPQAKVRVSIATNGDASYSTAFFHRSHTFSKQHFQFMAEQRQQESLTALMILGLTQSQISFWGFPDRGLSQLLQKYWNIEDAYRSPTTGYSRAEQTIHSPSLPYKGLNLLQLLQNELKHFKPTTIIVPHPQDSHTDHKALADITLWAVGAQHSQQMVPQRLAYMMWPDHKFWMTGARADKNLFTPSKKEGQEVGWKQFPLSKPILELKALALGCFHSQDFAAGKLLKEGAKNKRELFAVLPAIPSTRHSDKKQ
jgi:LmbE family N-acetylglucosaminyl deacetylase